MKLLVERIAKKSSYTIGKLYINGEYFCDTLEDKVRNLPKEPKVKGQTAIPDGKYNITFTYSPKFSKRAKYTAFIHDGMMPLLLNVPYFDAVRIHGGNTAKDSEGCILVGRNSVVGMVTDSLNYFRKLYERLWKAYKNNEFITIEIR